MLTCKASFTTSYLRENWRVSSAIANLCDLIDWVRKSKQNFWLVQSVKYWASNCFFHHCVFCHPVATHYSYFPPWVSIPDKRDLFDDQHTSTQGIWHFMHDSYKIRYYIYTTNYIFDQFLVPNNFKKLQMKNSKKTFVFYAPWLPQMWLYFHHFYNLHRAEINFPCNAYRLKFLSWVNQIGYGFYIPKTVLDFAQKNTNSPDIFYLVGIFNICLILLRKHQHIVLLSKAFISFIISEILLALNTWLRSEWNHRRQESMVRISSNCMCMHG